VIPLATHNPFGAVTGGKLILEAPMRQVGRLTSTSWPDIRVSVAEIIPKKYLDVHIHLDIAEFGDGSEDDNPRLLPLLFLIGRF
jgi:hypothetical protein